MTTDDEQRLKALLQQWHDNALPQHLQEELFGLLEKAEMNDSLAAEMQTWWEKSEKAEVFDAAQKEAMLASIMSHRKPQLFFIRLAAVAAVLAAVITIGSFLWRSPAEPTASIKPAKATLPVTDVAAPAINKATLTLADGSRIVVENSGEGNLATEGAVNVIKQGDGGLVYQGGATEVQWNTLTVPKGSKPMRLTLADGSVITLNVASSLTYPTAFAGPDRRVSLTGEAYFEIAKVPSGNGPGNKPFLVSAAGTTVEVTGTKFNVNGYEDEAATRTTLIEGAVNVGTGTKRLAIVPGEQAVVEAKDAGEIKLNRSADLEEATAWLNGKFRFNSAGVEAVMRQVARWYDVDVKYEARPRMRFGGQIDRGSSLRQMLTILEKSGLHFTLDGKTVTILP